jgi:hypothetical protein
LLRDLESVRVADPAAGAVDDFAVITEREVHGVQVKWPVYPGQFTLSSICSVDRHGRGPVRDLAEGWCRLREREARSGRGRRVVVHLATRDWPSQSRETARFDGCPQQHVAAFFRLGFRPVQDALRRGEPPPVDALTAWAAGFTAMMEASGLPDADSFHAFLTDLYIDVGVTDSPAVLAGLPGQTARLQRDVQRLAEYFFAVVAGLADDGDTVEITVERLLDALGWQHRPGFHNPHRFPVPVAYSPNEEVAEALTAVVREHTQGYVLLEGTPGSGKSTLLTATALPVDRVDRVDRVVRYYAYVPDSPDRASSRGEAENFLAQVCEELGQTGLPVVAMGGSLSAVRERLTDALDAAGQDWASRGVRAAIVVDGLDHIVREQNPVRSLLDELPDPKQIPDGVLFVLGSQTSEILPAAIRSHLADGRTIRMRPLDAHAVLAIADGTGVGRWLYPRQRNKLAAVTEGHPLALTYLLSAVAEARDRIAGPAEADDLVAATDDREQAGQPGSQPDALQAAVDGLLDTAEAYGSDVHRRYLGYWEQVAARPEIHRVLGVVARLRRPLLLSWLREWCGADAVARFAVMAAPLFDRDGDEWHFFHNSFRRFLEHQTAVATPDGPFDAGLDVALHASIADACRSLSERWPQFGDDELAHRVMAGQDALVLSAARPAMFMAQLDRLRPQVEVAADIRLALEVAVRQVDGVAVGRLALAMMEAAQREIALPDDDLVWAVIRFAPLVDARRHVLAGKALRVSPLLALRAAARFAAEGHGLDACRLFVAAGSLRSFACDEGSASRSGWSRDVNKAVETWATAAASLLAPSDALAQIDRALPHIDGPHSHGPLQTRSHAAAAVVDEGRPDDEPDTGDAAEIPRASAIYRRSALCALLAAWDIGQPVQSVAACVQRLWDLDWRQAALTEIDWAERMWDHGRVADARAVADRIVVRLTGSTETTIDFEIAVVLPVWIRIRLAELLVRVDGATGRSQPLVPSEETLPDRDRYQDPPWVSSYRLHRLRHLHGIGRSANQLVTATREAHQAGSVRFGRALLGLAELDAEVLRYELLGGARPVGLLARTRQLLRTYEVSPRQTLDWTQWHKITEFSEQYFERLADVVARADPTLLPALCNCLATRFTSAPGWSFYRRRPAVTGLIKAGAGVAWVAEQLAELEQMIQSGRAGLSPPERAEAWVALAAAHDVAADAQAAERAVREAARATTGLGIRDDDDQIKAWAYWLHRVVESASDPAGAAGPIMRFAARLHRYTDADRGSQFADAVASMIRTAWRVDPGWAVRLGEWALEQGMSGVPDLLGEQLVAAAEDSSLPPVAVAAAVASLLLPVRGHPPDGVWAALLRRSEDLDTIVKIIGGESRKWLSAGSRAQHLDQARRAVAGASREGAPADTEGWRTAFGLSQPAPSGDTSSYDPWERGELLVDGEAWLARRVRQAASDPAALIGLLGRASPAPVPPQRSYETFPWRRLMEELLPAADLRQVRRIAALIEPHQAPADALLVVARRLRALGDAQRARAVARSAVDPRPGQAPEVGGWSEGWGDTTRRHLWQLLVELDDPGARDDALVDVARTLRSSKINTARIAVDLYPMMSIIMGEAGAVELWPDIEDYLDRVVPVDGTPGPPVPSLECRSDRPPERCAAAAFTTLVTAFLGHPVRPLDFGARHVVATLLTGDDSAPHAGALAHECATRVASMLAHGGWPGEAAASILAAPSGGKPEFRPHAAAGHAPCCRLDPSAQVVLHDAIAAAVNSADLVISDLARRAALLHRLSVGSPPPQALSASYLLATPLLHPTGPPAVDPDTGAGLADPFDPQQRIAPYHTLLQAAAHQAGLAKSLVVYHGAMRADEPQVVGPAWWRRWTDGGSDGLQHRMKSHDIRTIFRPLPLLVGRRATAHVLSELMRGGRLPNPPTPRSSQDPPFLSEQFGFSQPSLTLRRPEPRPQRTPRPWLPDDQNAIERVWLDTLTEAVEHSVGDLDPEVGADEAGEAGTAIVAEVSHWYRNDRERPQEHRRRAPVPARAGVLIGSPGLTTAAPNPDGTADQVEFDSMFSIDQYNRAASAAMCSAATGRLNSRWAQPPWIVRGDAMWAEAPFSEWLAIDPWLAAGLGWILDQDGLFRWVTADGEPRAWSRGWVEHDDWTSYPSGDDFADGWQVLLTDAAVAELQDAVGTIDILADLRSALGRAVYRAALTDPVWARRSLARP